MEKNFTLKPWVQRLHLLSLIGAVVLIIALSTEIIAGERTTFSPWYMTLQLGVCILFLADLTLRWIEHGAQGWKAPGYLIFLLLAIPWLNIAEWSHWHLTREEAMIIATMPLLRAFLALYLVISWMIEGRARRLFWAYVITVVVFTYLSALLFYDFEAPVNPHLHGFGNALWWAWMNVTTVGAAIFPVTPIGKVICVLLPIVGMAMFPIFTVYITTLYSKK
ncbi:MAG: two pore domain potassium channel family protein [Rikenellaceae bacterium]|nr:two pore domain potassium channel family protein [Rikenellaceae bacterium]